MPSLSRSSLPRPRARAQAFVVLPMAVLVTAALLLGSPAGAQAADSSDGGSGQTGSTPPPADVTAPDPMPTEGAPVTVTVDDPGAVSSLPVTLTGTRSPGAQVQVQVSGAGGEPLCIAPSDSSAQWNCEVRNLPDGLTDLRIVALLDGGTDEASVRVAWLNAPTIQSAGRPTTAGQVGGAAHPGATVEASVVGAASSCTATADGTGAWTCILSEPLPTGDYSASARQTASFFAGYSAASSTVTVSIDKDAPAAPRITSPADGATLPLSGGAFAGTGEDGNTVLLFAGVHPLCQAAVTGGRWSCAAAAVPAGTVAVTAVQLDAAGNASSSSTAVSIRFDAAVASPAPTAPAPPGGTSPGRQVIPAPPVDQPQAGGSPSGPAGSQARPVPRWMVDLAQPTTLGSSLAPLTSVAGSQIATAFALSGGAFLLLLLPGLLASRSLAGRVGRMPSVTGRNRSRADARFSAVGVDRRAVAVASVAGAAVIVVLAHPVLAQANYARLAVAVTLALTSVNILGTVVVAVIARRVFGLDARVGTRVPLLGIAAFTALLTRALALAPPLAYGQVLGVDFGAKTRSSARANVALVQTGILIALALGAWTLYGSGPTSSAFLPQFLSEFASTVTFAAAGAAAIGMIPARSLPGGAVIAQSRLLWTAATILAWAVLFLVLTAVTETGSATGIVAGAITSAVFAAVSVAAWAWVRWVEPYLSRAE